MDYQHFTPYRTGAWVGTSMCGPAWGYEIMNSVTQETMANTAANTQKGKRVDDALSAQPPLEMPAPNWAPTGCTDGMDDAVCRNSSAGPEIVRIDSVAGTLPFTALDGEPAALGREQVLCNGEEIEVPELLNLDACVPCATSDDCAAGFECINSTWSINQYQTGSIDQKAFDFTVVMPSTGCNETTTCVAQTLPTDDIIACQLRDHPLFQEYMRGTGARPTSSWTTTFGGILFHNTSIYFRGNYPSQQVYAGTLPLFDNAVGLQLQTPAARTCKMIAYDAANDDDPTAFRLGGGSEGIFYASGAFYIRAAPFYGMTLAELKMTPTMLNALRRIMMYDYGAFPTADLPGCPAAEMWSCEHYNENDCPAAPACSMTPDGCREFSPTLEDQCIAAYSAPTNGFRPEFANFTDACCSIEQPNYAAASPTGTARLVRSGVASASRPLFTVAADLEAFPLALTSADKCHEALASAGPSRATMGFVVPDNLTDFDYGLKVPAGYFIGNVGIALAPVVPSKPVDQGVVGPTGWSNASHYAHTWPLNDLADAGDDIASYASPYFTFGEGVQCELLVEGRHYFDPGASARLMHTIDDAPTTDRLCVPMLQKQFKANKAYWYSYRFSKAVSAVATARYLQAPPGAAGPMPPQFTHGGPGGLLAHDPRVSIYYMPTGPTDPLHKINTGAVIVADDRPQLMCCAAGTRCNVAPENVSAYWEQQGLATKVAQCGERDEPPAMVGGRWAPTVSDIDKRKAVVATGAVGLQAFPVNRSIRLWVGEGAGSSMYGLQPAGAPAAITPAMARVVPLSVSGSTVEFVVVVENSDQYAGVTAWHSWRGDEAENVTVFIVAASELHMTDDLKYSVADASNPCGGSSARGKHEIVRAQLGSPGFDTAGAAGAPTVWLSMPNDNNFEAPANVGVSGGNRPRWTSSNPVHTPPPAVPGATVTWVYASELANVYAPWSGAGTNRDCQIANGCQGVNVTCATRPATPTTLPYYAWPARGGGKGPLPATSLFEQAALALASSKYDATAPPGFAAPFAAHRYVSLLSQPDERERKVPSGCRRGTFAFARKDVAMMWAGKERAQGTPGAATNNTCNHPDQPGGQTSLSARPPKFPADGRVRYTCSTGCTGCTVQHPPRQLPFTNSHDGKCRPNFWSQPADGTDWSPTAGSALSLADIALDTIAFTTNVPDTTPVSVGFGAGAAPMRAIAEAIPPGPSNFPVPADSKARPWTPAHDPDAARAVCRCGEGIEWACETLTAAFINDTYKVDAIDYQVRVCGYSWAGLGITGIGTAGAIGLYVGSDYVGTTVVERDSTKLYNGTRLTDIIGVRKPSFQTLKALVGSGSEWQRGVDATTTYPGACLRWPYGRLHRGALSSTDNQKYFPAGESDRPAGHDEALAGYCEKIDGRYLGCVGDPHVEDDRESWCAKRTLYTGKLFLGKTFLMDAVPCAKVPADNGVLCVVYAAHPRFPNVGAVTEWAQKELKYDGRGNTSLHLVVAPFGYAVASSLLLEQTTFNYHQSEGTTDDPVSWLAQYFSDDDAYKTSNRWKRGDPAAPVQGITNNESTLLRGLSDFVDQRDSTKDAADAAIALYKKLYDLIHAAYDGKTSPACTARQTYLPVPPAVNMKEQLEPVLPPGGSCVDSVQWGPHLVARGAVISVPNVYIRSGREGVPINVAGTAALSFSPSPSGLCTALIIRQPGVVVDPLVIDQAGCNGGPGYASIGVVVTGDSAAGGWLKGVTVKNAEGSAAVGILGGDRDFSATRPTLDATGFKVDSIAISGPPGSSVKNYDAAVAHVRSAGLTLPENATVLLEELSAAETVVFTNRVALTNVSSYTSVFGQPYEQQYYHPPIDMTHAAITALAVLSATGAAQAWALVQLMHSNVVSECPAPETKGFI